MRLSVKKAAPANMGGAEYRKSGYLSRFSRNVGYANLNVLCQMGAKGQPV
jgi:hypothetical protein